MKCAVVFTSTTPSTSVPSVPVLLVILSAFRFAVLSSPTRRYPDPPDPLEAPDPPEPPGPPPPPPPPRIPLVTPTIVSHSIYPNPP